MSIKCNQIKFHFNLRRHQEQLKRIFNSVVDTLPEKKVIMWLNIDQDNLFLDLLMVEYVKIREVVRAHKLVVQRFRKAREWINHEWITSFGFIKVSNYFYKDIVF